MMTQTNSAKLTLKSPLTIMLIVTIVPLVLAFVMYFGQVGVPIDRVNNGILLLPPVNLEQAGIDVIKESDVVSEQAKWSILFAPMEQCDSSCQEALHVTRQLHLALGKEAYRVKRIYVDNATTANLDLEALIAKYPNMQLIRLSDTATLTEGAGIYLVDPNSNVMMFYEFEQTGKPILKDLKKLLKNSNIG